MKILVLFCKKLEIIMKFCIGWMLILMSVLAFTGVLTRYFFFYSIPWLEEATRYLMVWMTFLVGALAVNDESHINIDFAPNFFNKKVKHMDANIILNILILIGIGCFAYFNFFQIGASMKSGVVSPVLRIPMWMMYCSTIVCAGTSVLFCIKNIYLKILKLKGVEKA